MPKIPIPAQMDKFWSSEHNKCTFQKLSKYVMNRMFMKKQIDVIFSGIIENGELLSATYVNRRKKLL